MENKIKKISIVNRIIMFTALFLTLSGSIMFAFNPIISAYGHLVLVFASILWSYMAKIMKDQAFLTFIILFLISNILMFFISI